MVKRVMNRANGIFENESNFFIQQTLITRIKVFFGDEELSCTIPNDDCYDHKKIIQQDFLRRFFKIKLQTGNLSGKDQGKDNKDCGKDAKEP
jgi:hypothetical protein